jgi:DNA-binding CsgD family transcriptional regulator
MPVSCGCTIATQKGVKTGLAERRPGAVVYSRLLLQPRALAGRPREGAASLVCVISLGFVLGVEVATPDTVVAPLVLLPVLAACWLLSNRHLAAVGVVTAGIFSLALVLEARNSRSFVVILLVTLITGVVTRLYATGLARALSNRTDGARSTWPGIENMNFSKGAEPGIGSLTRRELEVARLAAMGSTAAEIGAGLHIGERTVESHLAKIYSKLQINSRSKLIRMAVLLDDDAHFRSPL